MKAVVVGLGLINADQIVDTGFEVLSFTDRLFHLCFRR
jgi:hypothetical protein